MNISDYTRLATTFDTHRPKKMLDALTHGLVSEAIEVMESCQDPDRLAILEELGDVYWELSQLALQLKVSTGDLEEAEATIGPSTPSLASLSLQLVKTAGHVSGQMEKYHRVNRPPATRSTMKRLVEVAWMQASWLAKCAGFTPERVRQANIEKLTVRYGKEAA